MGGKTKEGIVCSGFQAWPRADLARTSPRIFLSPSQTHVHTITCIKQLTHTRVVTVRTRVLYFSLHLPSAIIYPLPPPTSVGTTGYLISHAVRKYSYVRGCKKYMDVSYFVQICAHYVALRYSCVHRTWAWKTNCSLSSLFFPFLTSFSFLVLSLSLSLFRRLRLLLFLRYHVLIVTAVF